MSGHAENPARHSLLGPPTQLALKPATACQAVRYAAHFAMNAARADGLFAAVVMLETR